MTTSPCIGQCRLDSATELCTGCARSGAEVAAWKDASAAVRARIWAELPERRAELGIGLHRLGWSPSEILDFVANSLQAGQGSWVVGIDGASAHFAVEHADTGTIDRDGPTITATTASGGIRFTITDRVRVLALPQAGERDAPPRERIILAVPRSQTLPRPNAGLTPLGVDRAAIHPADRAARLYDLGLNLAAASVCLRTSDHDLAAELDRRAGQDWGRLREDLRDRLARAALCRVITNPIARIEGFPPLDPDRSRPRVRFDPGQLALGRETDPRVDLPESFLPCATFDPMVGPPGIAAQPS